MSRPSLYSSSLMHWTIGQDDASDATYAIHVTDTFGSPVGASSSIFDSAALSHLTLDELSTIPTVPLPSFGELPVDLSVHDTLPINDPVPLPIDHPIPLPSFGVLTDGSSISHDIQTALTGFDIDVSDSKHLLTGNQADLIKTDMVQAAKEWMDQIDNPNHVPINIQINISDDIKDGFLANGSPGYLMSTGTGPNATWESAVEYKLQNGSDPTGFDSSFPKLSDGEQADVVINVNAHDLNSFYLDPNPGTGSAGLPNDKYDMVGLLAHEFGHGLGIGVTQTLDTTTGTFGAGEKTTWESLLDIETSGTYFIGSHAEREHGGPVVVTTDTPGENYQHFGNSFSDAFDPKHPFQPEVMTGTGLLSGVNYSISPLDVAVLQDLGYRTGPALNDGNISQVGHPTPLDIHSLGSDVTQDLGTTTDQSSLVITQAADQLNPLSSDAHSDISALTAAHVVAPTVLADTDIAQQTDASDATDVTDTFGSPFGASTSIVGSAAQSDLTLQEPSPISTVQLSSSGELPVDLSVHDTPPVNNPIPLDPALATPSMLTISPSDGTIGPSDGTIEGFTAGILTASPGDAGIVPDTVSSRGSGFVFVNSYGSGVTSKFHDAVVAAEHELQGYFKDSVTVYLNFDLQKISDKFSANNSYDDVQVSYGQLKDALTAHATTDDDYAAVASLPGTDPSNGAKFDVPIGMARNLGLAPAGDGSQVDDTIILNSDQPWNYDRDAIGVLQHEISEGIMGRVSLLGLKGSPDWAPMDLFRYAPSVLTHLGFSSENVHDYSGGADGRPTYFSVDGTSLLTQFHNSIDTNGNDDGKDLADWDGTLFDSFGPGGGGFGTALSSVDLRLLDILGWTPTTGILSELQHHTITPPHPGPGVPHDDSAPISSNMPASVDLISTPDTHLMQNEPSTISTVSLSSSGALPVDLSVHDTLLSNDSIPIDNPPADHPISIPFGVLQPSSSVHDTQTILQISHGVQTALTGLDIDVSDPKNLLTGNQAALLEADMAKAASEWMDHLENPQHTPINILLNITTPDHPGVEGHPAFLMDSGGTAESAVEYKLQNGADPAGLDGFPKLSDGAQADVIINVNSDFVNKGWLDPNPAVGSDPVPADKFDVVSALLYEFGHGLGFGALNALETATGTFGTGEKTTWESLLDIETSGTYFIGSHAEREHGGPVVVTTGDYADLGNAYTDREVMSAGHFPGVNYSISPLDVAILQDLGYATKGPVLNDGNISQVAHPTPLDIHSLGSTLPETTQSDISAPTPAHVDAPVLADTHIADLQLDNAPVSDFAHQLHL